MGLKIFGPGPLKGVLGPVIGGYGYLQRAFRRRWVPSGNLEFRVLGQMGQGVRLLTTKNDDKDNRFCRGCFTCGTWETIGVGRSLH